jgi:serine/threonine-protein kinase HipA
MSDREIVVYVDLDGSPALVGRLWVHVRHGRESATFAYDRSWLQHSSRFSLDPALTLGTGAFHTEPDRPLFGAMGDSAPDRWGRVLMRRAERRRAASVGEHPRTLFELDYLLKVDDEAREGALRFAEKEGGPFLATDPSRIPPMVALPRLLTAAEHVSSDRDTDDDLRLLLAPGSSVGGARPKASVRDRDGRLMLAKFPQVGDEFDVVTWEAVALTLADRAGVPVPDRRLERVRSRPVLVLGRFDRRSEGLGEQHRIPFLSAMSMLGARDNETRSYLEIADALRSHGAEPQRDLRDLWRRIVFNILISNTDDHLRNHGFLRTGRNGWRLSPAYDLNPVPVDVKPRILTTAIDLDDPTASLPLALEVADYFELTRADARQIAAEVGRAVRSWRAAAHRMDLTRAEIERMASAFEHKDLELAATLG